MNYFLVQNFLKLPILDDVSSSPVLPPVRKIYGKKVCTEILFWGEQESLGGNTYM